MAPAHFANNNIEMLWLPLKYRADVNVAGEPVLGAESTPEYIDFALEHGVDLENQYYNGTVLTLAA